MGTLLVAAGGGGDAITAAVLASALDSAAPTAILTYSWDRLIIDPLPGPRSTADFTGLRDLAAHVLEVLASSQAVRPAGSSLPRLAADVPSRLLILDPSGGAVGMTEQIRAAADLFDADGIDLVDVGGDVLTVGKEPGIRSPLADLLALAACAAAGRPCRLLVAAPGVDGELAESTVLQRLEALGAVPVVTLSADAFRPVCSVFRWHPSEASALVAAAAHGIRGSVEVRDSRQRVHLTDNTPAVFAVDAHKAALRSPAAALTSTTTLVEAARIVEELTGVNELQYETQKAARLTNRATHTPSEDDLPAVDEYSAQAAARGTDYITIRRLAELLGISGRDALADFRALLAGARPSRYLHPLPLFRTCR
jgi:hypothetical protein